MGRKESLNRLRDVLVIRREAIQRALSGDLSLLNELREKWTGDSVDVASDTAQDEINSQLAEVESRELKSIDAALQRLKDGTYGECEGCQSPIPLCRLQALPYATCCIECKRKLEEHGYRSGQEVDWSVILDTGIGDSDNSFAT